METLFSESIYVHRVKSVGLKPFFICFLVFMGQSGRIIEIGASEIQLSTRTFLILWVVGVLGSAGPGFVTSDEPAAIASQN